MPRRLPSLSALRTFEAAARHQSFKHAAQELAVTPVAITRQVKALEAELGLALFVRHHRGVALTEAGRELAAGLGHAFTDLHAAVERTRRRAGLRLLRIGVDRVFGERWLAPRLDAFRRLHPGLDVALTPPDDAEAWLDGVIDYGSHVEPGPRRHLLLRETVFPVCSPALLRGRRPLSAPGDLAHHRLLHEGSIDWWQRWLHVAGADSIEATAGAAYLAPGKAYEAAVAGRGVIIGDDIVTADDLLAGRLVRPFVDVFEGNTYALLCNGPEGDQAMAAFAGWLIEAGRSHKAEMRRHLGLTRKRAGTGVPARRRGA